MQFTLIKCIVDFHYLFIVDTYFFLVNSVFRISDLILFFYPPIVVVAFDFLKALEY